jgi:hypothetical protein
VAGAWAGYYQLSESLGWDYETESLTHVNAYPFDPQKVFLMCPCETDSLTLLVNAYLFDPQMVYSHVDYIYMYI